VLCVLGEDSLLDAFQLREALRQKLLHTVEKKEMEQI
jgi:hypothetical protein